MRIGVLSGLFLCLVGFTAENSNTVSACSTENLRVEHIIKADDEGLILLPEREVVYSEETAPEIENFKLQQEYNSVILTWETAQNDEILFFEIERSFDREEFVQIGLVSSMPTPYDGIFSFYDQARFLGNKSYYRLKMKNNHGAISTSNILELENGKLESLELSPNPATNHLTVKVPESFSDGVLVIKSTQGKILLRKNIENQQLDNYVILISDLPAGLAMVCLEQENQIWSKLVLIYN